MEEYNPDDDEVSDDELDTNLAKYQFGGFTEDAQPSTQDATDAPARPMCVLSYY